MGVIGYVSGIAGLKKELAELKFKRQKKKSDRKDYEDAYEKLTKKAREIEEGLQETESTMSKWLDKIPANTKFRQTYFETAKAKFLNGESSAALEHVRESKRTTQRRIDKLDEEIEELNEKIKALEKEIDKKSVF